jgi:cathepsin B
MKVPCTLAFVGVALAAPTTMADHDSIRAAFIEELNAMPGTWTAGFNSRFQGMPIGEEMKPLLGVHSGNLADIDAAVARGDVYRYTDSLYAPEDVPTDFDSATNFAECADIIDDIRDQSACGCCWAFGAAESASDRLCITTKGQTKMPLSAQDVCFNGSYDGCDGGMLYSAWQYIQSSGVVTGGQYQDSGPFPGYCSSFSLPHCHHHGPDGHGGDPYPDEGTPGCPNARSPPGPTSCDSTAKAPHNNFNSDKWSFSGLIKQPAGEAAMQSAIMSGGPIEAAFSVYADFANYVGGVYSHKSGSFMGGHAIKIVGWGVDNGVKYWKVANSWNKYYGENGYFRILRGTNECGIESQAMYGDGDWSNMN